MGLLKIIACAIGLVTGATWLLACGSDPTETAGTGGAGGGGTGGTGGKDGVLPAGDLGKSCTGSCAGSELCTSADATCETGHCLSDPRAKPGEFYCTAECSEAECPPGFLCEDVPFELKRACVRDDGSTGEVDDPRVKGTVTLKGAFGKIDAPPEPFDNTYAFDSIPVSELDSIECGKAFVNYSSTPYGSENGLQIYLRACNTESPEDDTNGYLLIEVPFRKGTLPDGDASAFYPKVDVSVGSVEEKTLARYGGTVPTEGVTLNVHTLVGVQDTSLPWSVEEIGFDITGTLQKDDSCTGSACGSSADTLSISISLGLTDITLPH